MRVWAFSANWSFDLVLISVLACCKYMNLVMIYLYYIWTYDYKRCARFLPTKWPDPLTFSPFPCHWLWTILWTWHMEITHKTNVHKKKRNSQGDQRIPWNLMCYCSDRWTEKKSSCWTQKEIYSKPIKH